MRNHPLSTWIEEERRVTDARIRSAFRGVSRNAGVSWSESVVLDDYGTDDERKLARANDTERSWEQLVDDPKWDPEIPCGGFSFLDSTSARYFLAPWATD